MFDIQPKFDDDLSSNLSEKIQTCKNQSALKKKGTAIFFKHNTVKTPQMIRLLTTEEKQKEG